MCYINYAATVTENMPPMSIFELTLSFFNVFNIAEYVYFLLDNRNIMRHKLFNSYYYSTLSVSDAMKKKFKTPTKNQFLKKHDSLNLHPERVKSDLFRENEFFDPHDLVQVKYEMLRLVQKAHVSISRAVCVFGFSRPSFYRIMGEFEQNGMAGLIPKKRGPRKRHKLNDEIMSFIEDTLEKEPSLSIESLTHRVEEEYNITVHRRSIERARSKKKSTRTTNRGA